LIPWSTDGVFIYGTLGITVLEYGPFAVMNYAAPIIALILAATGIGIKKITDEDKLNFYKKYYPNEIK
ncbi:MAG TPA: Na+/H+ antiporter NhaC, partial [Candidatus Nosocomiicoccus stercorigallinarum]|nr:Na+/H+ antiporter NhaC [Candidatus Nosocomiicoccus stercorigallinarum]